MEQDPIAMPSLSGLDSGDPASPLQVVVDTAETEATRLKEESVNASKELIKDHLVDHLCRNPSATYRSWIAVLHPENAHVEIDARMLQPDNAWLGVWHEVVAMRTAAICPRRLNAVEAQMPSERHGGLIDSLMGILLMVLVILTTALLYGVACCLLELAWLCGAIARRMPRSYEPLAFGSPFEGLLMAQAVQKHSMNVAGLLVLQTFLQLWSTLLRVFQIVGVTFTWVLAVLQPLLMVIAGICMLVGTMLREVMALAGFVFCGGLALSWMQGTRICDQIRHFADVTQMNMCHALCSCIAASERQFVHIAESYGDCAGSLQHITHALQLCARRLFVCVPCINTLTVAENSAPPELSAYASEEDNAHSSTARVNATGYEMLQNIRNSLEKLPSCDTLMGMFFPAQSAEPLQESPGGALQSRPIAMVERLFETACRAIRQRLDEFLFDLHAVPRASEEVSEAFSVGDGDFIDLGTPAHSGMTTSATHPATQPFLAERENPSGEADPGTITETHPATQPFLAERENSSGEADPGTITESSSFEYVTCSETASRAPHAAEKTSGNESEGEDDSDDKARASNAAAKQKRSTKRPIRRGGQWKKIQKRGQSALLDLPDTDDGWTD